jgi:hypothetical protein
LGTNKKIPIFKERPLIFPRIGFYHKIIRILKCRKQLERFQKSYKIRCKKLGAWLNNSQRMESQIPSPGFPEKWESNSQYH